MYIIQRVNLELAIWQASALLLPLLRATTVPV
jgi:hypothetical protein